MGEFWLGVVVGEEGGEGVAVGVRVSVGVGVAR
jgi:hypothetical protein